MLPPHCNPTDSPVEEEGPLSIGTRLGEFEIRGLVGAGRTGVVYRAFDHELEREVAVREYLPRSLAMRAEDGQVQLRESGHAHAFGIGLQQFLRQAQLLARFDHPALVKVFRYWEGQGTAYMVMPFYAGQTLAQALRLMPAPPTETWLLGVLVPLLGALDSLHSQQILHRRITPDNIRLLRNGRPVLLEPDRAQEDLHPGYAPVEQMAEGPDLRQGPWTDLYALGAVVHAALTGRPPPSAQARAVQDDLEPLTDVAARLATLHGLHYRPAFLAAWQQTLSRRPVDRPQNVQVLLLQLGLLRAPAPAVGEWTEVRSAAPAPAATPEPAATAPTVTAALPVVNALAPLEARQPRSYGSLVLAVLLAGLLGAGVVGYRLSRTAPGDRALQPPPAAASAETRRPPPVILDELPESRAQGPASAAMPVPGPGPMPAAARASTPASKAALRTAPAASAASRAPAPPQASAAMLSAGSASSAPRNAVSTQNGGSRSSSSAAPATPPSGAPRTLDTLCGARFFLARELCIQNACETAEFSPLPTCVDLRRKAEDERLRKLHTDG